MSKTERIQLALKTIDEAGLALPENDEMKDYISYLSSLPEETLKRFYENPLREFSTNNSFSTEKFMKLPIRLITKQPNHGGHGLRVGEMELPMFYLRHFVSDK